MVDPFESLRHDAEATGSTAIDPRFRADLLAEARRRLSSEASADSIRSRVTADTPTPTQMEPIPMLAKQPKTTQPFLLAAACVLLVAAGAVAVLALQDDEDDEPPAVIDTVPSTSTEVRTPLTEAATPQTTQPGTTSASQTTAAAQDVPTTIPQNPDDLLARNLLLTPAEYYPDLYPALTTLGIDWDPIQADALPACASYTDSVFQPIAKDDGYEVFHREAPLALAYQYASVLESEEQATSVMNAMAEPAFLQCGIDYQAADAGTNCCDGEKSLPEPLGFVQPSAPPFETVGDQLNFYTWATSWVDQNGVEHGQDDRLIGAFVRVGRAIVYVEGLVESSDTEPIVTPESFRQILENVVARAEAVLSGVEYEPPATTTLQPLSDAEVASSMMLTGDEYGPDWVVVPNMEPGVSINSAVAAEIPECVSFVDPVFRAVEQGSSTYRSFYHAEPQALFTQYVVVLRDAATARSVYELVNSPEFAACVTGHGTAVAAGASPSAFPSPVDKPISEPPFEPVGDALSYRTFEEIVRGPRTDLDAVMLVGRTITFMGTVVNGEGGATLNTADQFRLALERVVERANAVLAGTPVR